MAYVQSLVVSKELDGHHDKQLFCVFLAHERHECGLAAESLLAELKGFTA